MARTVIWIFVAAPLLYLLFVLGMRQLPPTAEQRRALALLEAPTPPVAGRDGTDAIWLAEHDVPPARQAEIGARYRDYLNRKLDKDSAATVDDPRAAFPRLEGVPPGGGSTCADQGTGCLDFVREHRAEVRDFLAAREKRLQATLGLSQYDGLRYGVTPGPTQELPRFQGMYRLVRTHLALEFAEGRQSEAIDALCRDIAGWRRMGGNSDYLLASMVGVSTVRQDLLLLGEMLAELPVAAALPESCAGALAASSDRELDLCPAMRTEFRGMQDVQALMDQQHQAEGGILRQGWLIDASNFRAALAPALSIHCEPALLQAAHEDRSVTALVRPPRACSAWRKAADPVGCILADVAMPGYARYADRRTDQAAMLALMRTALWLRSAAASSDEVPAALRRVPASLGLRRTPAFDPVRGTLAIPLLETSRGMYFELPVTPAAAPPAAPESPPER